MVAVSVSVIWIGLKAVVFEKVRLLFLMIG